jgi:hypothetical protein
MVVNRYTSSPVAMYNPLSMNELAFAPTFLRQRDDQVTQALSDLSVANTKGDVLDKYLPQYSELVDPIEQEINALAERLAKEGVNRSQAVPQAMKLKSKQASLFSPTGAVGQLESLKKQYQSVNEELGKRKDLEANPEVLNYARQQLQSSLPELSVKDGKLVGKTAIGSPNISRIFDVKERQEVFNNVIKNIQNDERFKGYSISSIGDINQLMTQGTLEYKDLDTIMQTMLAAVPQELYRSEATRMLANGYTQEEVQTVMSKTPYEVITDEKGKPKDIKYNLDNPVIREMFGMAGSRVVSKDKTRVSQFTDSKALASYNKKLEDTVGGYDLPNQVVTTKNEWMDGITDEGSLMKSISGLDQQIQEQANQYTQLGLDPNQFPQYTNMVKRKAYLEGMVEKVNEELSPVKESKNYKEVASLYPIDVIQKYQINSRADLYPPTMEKLRLEGVGTLEESNYGKLMKELQLPVGSSPTEIHRALIAYKSTGDPTKANELLGTGKGDIAYRMANSNLDKLFNVVNSTRETTKKAFNKITLAESTQDLSTGFTRETSKASQQAADDYLQAAFTNLIFVDPNTGEEIAGTNADGLAKRGITPETISYSSYSQMPTADGSYLWKVNNSPKNKEGKIGRTDSFIVKAPQQFGIKKAVMDLQSAVKNPNVNVKLMEQNFLSQITDAQSKGLSRIPLGQNYGDMFIGKTPEGKPLPNGISAIIKAPDGTNIPVSNPSQAFNYLFMLMQQENE